MAKWLKRNKDIEARQEADRQVRITVEGILDDIEKRGDEAVRATPSMHVDRQRVAAHDARRRVDEHVVGDRVAFGVQGLEDAKRPFMGMARHGAAAFA